MPQPQSQLYIEAYDLANVGSDVGRQVVKHSVVAHSPHFQFTVCTNPKVTSVCKTSGWCGGK